MITADEAAVEWIAEGASITKVVLLGDEEAASRMVRNVFDAHEFLNAIALVARLEVARLNNKLARYCCPNGESLGIRDTCCPECAAISDGYSEAMSLTPNVEHDRRPAASSQGVRVDGPVGPLEET